MQEFRETQWDFQQWADEDSMEQARQELHRRLQDEWHELRELLVEVNDNTTDEHQGAQTAQAVATQEAQSQPEAAQEEQRMSESAGGSRGS